MLWTLLETSEQSSIWTELSIGVSILCEHIDHVEQPEQSGIQQSQGDLVEQKEHSKASQCEQSQSDLVLEPEARP